MNKVNFRVAWSYRGGDERLIPVDLGLVHDLDLDPIEELPEGVEEDHVEKVRPGEKGLGGGLVGNMGRLRGEQVAEDMRDWVG